jgi:hypothetical protein
MDKWYVDQTVMGYEQLAFALQMQYPQLRVAIGPAALNEQYIGTNPPKQQIESFVAGFVPTPLQGGKPSGLRAEAIPTAPPNPPSPATPPNPPNPPKQIPASAGIPKRGDKVWVIIPGFGPVEADFVAALPDGQILIDLDGVQTPVERSVVHTDVLAAEAAAVAAPPAPEPPEVPAAAPEPEAAPEPSKASVVVSEPESQLKASTAAPEELPAPQAESA